MLNAYILWKYGYSGLIILLWRTGKNMFVDNLTMGCIETVWSNVKINEKWSAVSLRVEAFILEVEVSYQ